MEGLLGCLSHPQTPSLWIHLVGNMFWETRLAPSSVHTESLRANFPLSEFPKGFFLKPLLHTTSSEFSFCLILAFSEALLCLPIVPAFTCTRNFANCAVRKGLTETPTSGGISAWEVRRVRGESHGGRCEERASDLMFQPLSAN